MEMFITEYGGVVLLASIIIACVWIGEDGV